MPRMTKYEAANIANSYHIPLDQDFFQLHLDVVKRIVEAAIDRSYRKSKNAPGPTGRMFYEYLKRVAQS